MRHEPRMYLRWKLHGKFESSHSNHESNTLDLLQWFSLNSTMFIGLTSISYSVMNLMLSKYDRIFITTVRWLFNSIDSHAWSIKFFVVTCSCFLSIDISSSIFLSFEIKCSHKSKSFYTWLIRFRSWREKFLKNLFFKW